MRYVFGDMEFDTATRELRRARQPVDIRPKELEFLAYLLAHRDRVVSKNELMDTVWNGIIVGESALFACARRVRYALQGTASGAASEEIIRTYYGYGYRFIAEARELSEQPATAPSRSQPGEGPRASLPASGFVGRAVELERLGKALDGALSGSGRLVMLVGEPGIGKTRTAEELLARARNRGCETLTARCNEGGGGQAFWPWSQIVRAYASTRDAAAIANVFAAEAADLAILTSAAQATQHANVDPEVAQLLTRTRLFDAVVTVLRRIASHAPALVLFIDDLHWADASSLSLLQAVTNMIPTTPLLVIGTYRDAEVEPAALLRTIVPRLQPTNSGEVLYLGPLGESDGHHLLSGLVGAPVSAPLAARVLQETEGNPFFVGEYWRHLVDEGFAAYDGQTWQWRPVDKALGVSEGIRVVLHRRLQHVGSDTRITLAIAAVAGREFSFELLERITGLSPDTVVDALDDAVRAQLVLEPRLPGQPYRFAHAWVRAALYDDLSSMRRAVLHRHLANHLEQNGAESLLSELAHHFVQAAPAGTAIKAIDFARRAGHQSIAHFAYEDAAAWFEQALATADTFTDQVRDTHVVPELRCSLLLELGSALQLAGDGVGARKRLEAAAGLARDIPLPAAFVQAVLGIATQWTFDDPAVIALLEEAVATVGDADPGLRAAILGRLASALYYRPAARERRAALCSEAVATARRLGDNRVLVQALADSVAAQWYSDNLAEQLTIADELVTLAERGSDRRALAQAHGWRTVIRMGCGDLRGAEVDTERLSHLAEQLREPSLRWNTLRFRTTFAQIHGDLAAAERYAQQALEIGRSVSERAAELSYNGALLMLRRDQGRHAEGLAMIAATRYGADAYAAGRWTLPYFYSQAGKLSEARDAFAQAINAGFDSLPPENGRNTRLFAIAAAGGTCVALDDAEHATAVYAIAQPYATQWLVGGWGIVCTAPMQNTLGLMATVLRRWQAATNHFETALAMCVQQGALVAHVDTQCKYARMLLKRGRPSDRRKARTLIEEALRTSRSHALDGWTALLQELLGEAGS